MVHPKTKIMLLHQVFALLLLLLYFWYVVGSREPRIVQPTSQRLDVDPDNSYTFKEEPVHTYQCSFAGQIWKTNLPEGYLFRPHEIRPQDPCYTVADHDKVLATGSLLYEYLQNELLQSGPNSSIEVDASTASQDRKVFYFECLNKAILKLHQCPPGHVFRNNDCLPISICLDQQDGAKFPDPMDSTFYYQCVQSKLVRKQCIKSWWFDYHQCQVTSFQYFCQHDAFQVLNENTLLVCDRGRATFETCPPRYRYFENLLSTEKPVCESDYCVGVTSGQKKSLYTKIKHGLVYTPGYVACHNDRVKNRVECPREWDTFSIDHQLPLPQVFDMKIQDCTVPKFCENVDPANPDIIVPVQEWTKQLPLWKYSSLMDQVTGYKCDASGARARTSAPAGDWIGRHMKMESACQDGTVTMVPVSGMPGNYYDCGTRRTMFCGHNHFFNGESCQRYTKHAFQYNGLDVYEMDSLNLDFWIETWHPTSMNNQDITLKRNCNSPFIYNQLYNICVHRDCTLYPFLSQIDFLIGLRDGSTCQYNVSTRCINKMDPVSDEKYLYWTQQMTHDQSLVDNEPCQEGQSIQSGQFVFDKTIFATCDPQQPFVFCPSPQSMGIEKRNGVFTCKPNDNLLAQGIMGHGETREFEVNELHQLSSTKDTKIEINRDDIPMKANIPLDLTKFKRKMSRYGIAEIRTTDTPITLYYNARNSYPPHVVRFYNNGRLSRVETGVDGEAYSISHEAFITLNSQQCGAFATYTPKPLLPKLKLE